MDAASTLQQTNVKTILDRYSSDAFAVDRKNLSLAPLNREDLQKEYTTAFEFIQEYFNVIFPAYATRRDFIETVGKVREISIALKDLGQHDLNEETQKFRNDLGSAASHTQYRYSLISGNLQPIELNKLKDLFFQVAKVSESVNPDIMDLPYRLETATPMIIACCKPFTHNFSNFLEGDFAACISEHDDEDKAAFSRIGTRFFPELDASETQNLAFGNKNPDFRTLDLPASLKAAAKAVIAIAYVSNNVESCKDHLEALFDDLIKKVEAANTGRDKFGLLKDKQAEVMEKEAELKRALDNWKKENRTIELLQPALKKAEIVPDKKTLVKLQEEDPPLNPAGGEEGPFELISRISGKVGDAKANGEALDSVDLEELSDTLNQLENTLKKPKELHEEESKSATQAIQEGYLKAVEIVQELNLIAQRTLQDLKSLKKESSTLNEDFNKTVLPADITWVHSGGSKDEEISNDLEKVKEELDTLFRAAKAYICHTEEKLKIIPWGVKGYLTATTNYLYSYLPWAVIPKPE